MNLCTSFHSRSMFHIENTAIWTSEFSQDVTQNRNAASLKKSLSYWRKCLCARMLVLEWKERAFKEKVNSRCFCWFPTAILLHQNGSPIWRLHTKLYKGAWNGSANNSETVGNKDLRHFIFSASSTGRFPINFFVAWQRNRSYDWRVHSNDPRSLCEP